MGACQSCLGIRRREDHESEHARLIDDDLYPGGYGYGSINNANQQQHDPEDLKREREALEAICQRASDTVIDIWALQSQPNFQPRATLPSNDSPGSSRVPSNEIRTPILNGGDGDAHNDNQIRQEAAAGTVSSRPSSSSNIGQKNLAPVPNNWGEVVISPRRKKGNKKAGVVNGAEGGDIFGVLRVN
ncbi:hypothetical protein TMatcc_003493 [Talaromyces marneffei ATCC 18224]|nr:uncharacterized protein EYB26_001468 [Talaromyces marneffei]KAE8556163.1 hypothetical protein EYB25_000863 [Talaromyces marneffei]QGA13817.1 hypothetical protein EYB26_001468 [Talaromyces marneffei]